MVDSQRGVLKLPSSLEQSRECKEWLTGTTSSWPRQGLQRSSPDWCSSAKDEYGEENLERILLQTTAGPEIALREMGYECTEEEARQTYDIGTQAAAADRDIWRKESGKNEYSDSEKIARALKEAGCSRVGEDNIQGKSRCPELSQKEQEDVVQRAVNGE
jgi:hypothetical protein